MLQKPTDDVIDYHLENTAGFAELEVFIDDTIDSIEISGCLLVGMVRFTLPAAEEL